MHLSTSSSSASNSHGSRPHLSPAASWAVLRPFLVIVVGMVATLLVLGEVVTRLAGWNYPSFSQSDPDRGWAQRPGAKGIFRDENKIGVFIQMSKDGLRDVDHALAKPAGTFRIALLGNSYSEALHVPLEQTFWRVAGQEVEKCRPNGLDKVEMINFGVGGYGTAQELITLQKHVWKYSPDLILVGFLTGNDVYYNYRALVGHAGEPYYVYKNDRLELDDSFKRNLKLGRMKKIQQQVEDKVQLAGAVIHLRNEIKQWMFTGMQKLKASKNTVMNESEKTNTLQPTDFVYVPPKDGDWAEAWKVTEGILRLMKQEVASHNVPLVISTLSNSPQVNPDLKVREEFMRQLGVNTLFYPDERIRLFGEREGIPVVTIAPGMAELAQKENIFLHGFPGNMGKGHWNQTGNRVAGEAIGAGICKALSK